jgi:hypothetical protein
MLANGEGGGGGGGGWLVKFLPDIKKKGRKIFPDINQLKNSCQNMRETLIFGPISVKFRSTNPIPFPLKAL